MKIGILSDSHGDSKITRDAIALLERNGAEKLIHCGDLCGQTVLDELVGHDCVFVWGNCDRPDASTRVYLQRIGLPSPTAPLRITLAGKRIAVCHGHELSVDEFVDDESLDYVFHGHSHQMRDERRGNCRIINPGALYRAALHTVALLNLETDELQFFEVETGRVITPVTR